MPSKLICRQTVPKFEKYTYEPYVTLEVLSKFPLQNHHAASWQHVVFDGEQMGVFRLLQESLKSFYPPKSPRMLQFCPFPLRHCGIFAMDSHCNPWWKTKGQKQRNLRKTNAILDIICHLSGKKTSGWEGEHPKLSWKDKATKNRSKEYMCVLHSFVNSDF